MELHQAQAFVAVARERSFTRASAGLHRSQPAVSQAVAALERELRTVLLQRLPREVRPTAAGDALLARLEPLLGQWEAIATRLREDLSSEPEGDLAIGAGETALLHLLPETVLRFRARHPAVRLLFRHQRRDDSLAALAAGTIDLAVRSAAELPPGMLAETLIDIPRVVIAPAAHPLAGRKRVSWKHLAGESWVLPPAGTEGRRELALRIADAGGTLQVSVETGGWELVKRYVSLGLGLSAVPERTLSAGDRRNLAVLPVSPALPAERFQLWLGQDAMSRPAARAFCEILRETVTSG